MIVIFKNSPPVRMIALSIILAATLSGCGGGGSSEQNLGYRLTPDGGPVQPLGNDTATLNLTPGAVPSAVDITATTAVAPLTLPHGLATDTPLQIVQFLGVSSLSLNAPVTLTMNAPKSVSGVPVIVTMDNGTLVALPTVLIASPTATPASVAMTGTAKTSTVKSSVQINGQNRFSSSGIYEVVYNNVPDKPTI